MAALVQEFSAYLQTLNSLPPSVNRYDAVADWIANKADILNRPTWALDAISCYISWPIWFIVIAVSAEILIARRAWHSQSWLSFDRGLIRLNAGNWMAVLAIAYGIVTLIEVTIELTIPADPIGHSSATWYTWEVAQFIPFYLIGVVYFISIAGSCLIVSDTSVATSKASQASRRIVANHGRTILAWFINITGILMSIAAVTVITTLVCLSRHYAAPFRDDVNESLVSLRNAAPSYNPSTFSVALILPLVTPLASGATGGEKALQYLRDVWIAWLSLIAFLAIVFAPFSTYHLIALRRVAKARKDLTTKSNTRATSFKPWHRLAVRWVERLNPYYVVLAQTVAYYAVIVIHVGLAAWLVVLTSRYEGSAIVPVVGRFAGQIPFALVYIAATLFQRYQLAIRNAPMTGPHTSAPPLSGIRVTQIITQRSSSPGASFLNRFDTPLASPTRQTFHLSSSMSGLPGARKSDDVEKGLDERGLEKDEEDRLMSPPASSSGSSP